MGALLELIRSICWSQRQEQDKLISNEIERITNEIERITNEIVATCKGKTEYRYITNENTYKYIFIFMDIFRKEGFIVKEYEPTRIDHNKNIKSYGSFIIEW